MRQELAQRASTETRFSFDEAAYRADIARIRRERFETTLDLPIPGVSAVTAPVFDFTGEMKLAITVIGPTQQIDLSRNGAAVRATLGFAQKLSTDLGYHPG